MTAPTYLPAIACRTLLLLCLTLLTGCRSALIAHYTRPYRLDLNASPIGTKQVELPIYRIEEPVSGYDASVTWSTRRILEEARRCGMNDVHYVDRRTTSILFGLFEKQTLILHGDGVSEKALGVRR